ncbi:hypothetical protein SLE2022_020800 [Rubroshorea leprosula]
MSSTTSGSPRERGQPSFHGCAWRMVCLPRSILGGFSRAFGRRSQDQTPNFQLQDPRPPQAPLILHEEWAFLSSIEQQYGSAHPIFYACKFMEALKLAEDEHKFVFMYLHSPEHPFTPSFCTETLCSELVIQFLDANFVSWGALADREEGLQMVATLRPTTYPFCALIAPAPGNNIAVLRQIEGPIGPAELVEILQRTIEEKGLAFGNKTYKEEERRRAKIKEEEKVRADRQLREEQDAAYFSALQIDKENESLRNGRVQPANASNKTNNEKLRQTPAQKLGKPYQPSTVRQIQNQVTSTQGKDPQTTQLLIRFPNGERREQSFSCTDKIQSVYRYIDSLGLPGIGNYRLVSGYPRKVYDADQMGMTLKDAGLHPRASLFLELL